MARIAVEESLSDIKQALQNNGHEVISMTANNLSNIQYLVITGQDNNVMGISEVATQASVINADGLTADEVVEQIDRRAGK